MNAFEKYASKRLLSKALSDRVASNALFGSAIGAGMGALQGGGDNPLGSALKGAVGGGLGGVVSTPFDLMEGRSPTLARALLPALAGSLAFSIPYSMVMRSKPTQPKKVDRVTYE